MKKDDEEFIKEFEKQREETKRFLETDEGKKLLKELGE